MICTQVMYEFYNYISKLSKRYSYDCVQVCPFFQQPADLATLNPKFLYSTLQLFSHCFKQSNRNMLANSWSIVAMCVKIGLVGGV
ncbi:hypothetical protein Hanom_Chr10g00958791 [Helianthus anomalus]